MKLRERITAAFQAIGVDVKAIKAEVATHTTYFEQVVWAENNGLLTNNESGYSFGDGSTGDIGIPSFWDCEAVGMVFQSGGVGNSVVVSLRVNGVNTSRSITANSGSAIVEFETPLPIYKGDVVGFRTTTVSGFWTNTRVGYVVRVTPNM